MNENLKKLAAEKAVETLESGMIVGLGTGSTAYWAIKRIAERVWEGLDIKGVPSSERSEQFAAEWEIPLIGIEEIDRIDVTIDGADEIDPFLRLIKGGGGALLREKVLAANSDKLLIIADESKCVETLGRFPLPVEIVPFAVRLTLNRLRELGCTPTVRLDGDRPYWTDNGNFIADCQFGSIADPEWLAVQLNQIPGVVENGLFVRMASAAYIGRSDGTVEIIK
ncbi:MULTISPECIES: ribose-5-phosphate isomerase RpiA [Paenibacillus]|uniref:ribose-5-phosphate isomerase RpiA n=1 Tax=Paenibacillus TaxID=44249 RepID=UPI0008808C52|nr:MULTISPECIES: ribose-5-phosphate isomerase RpiA [Paenibacillus]GCL71099.1 ribose-5-phosphate isomerase RpiA [Paenibacillus naphthalenovorans]SDI63138.1 ribose 5-phosphate isomerase A [Paenibacillus naphthalenovorans]